MSLNKIDRHILYELDVNARQPLSMIAKKLKINKDTLKYRIKRMEDENIILGYQTFVNHGKLGFFGTRFNLKLQNTTPEIEEDIIKTITENPKVGFFVSVEGNIDYSIWVVTKSIQELNEFWQKLQEKYQQYLQEVKIGIYTRIDHYPRSSLIDKNNTINFPFYTVDSPEEIDNVELNLLKLISKNARIPIIELARQLKITPKTAASKIKSLEKRGIISGYSVILNVEKLGYQYYKLHIDLQNITPQLLRKWNQFLLMHPYVTYRDYVIGGNSTEIEMQLPGEKELRHFIDEMKREFSLIIRQHEVLYFYKEHKLLSMPWA